jgi:hypothetical protein
MNTGQLAEFINSSVEHLNEEFHLNIHFQVLADGKTKVAC